MIPSFYQPTKVLNASYSSKCARFCVLCKRNSVPQKKWPFHHLFVTREGIYGRLALLHHRAVRKGMGGGLLGRPYYCRIRVLFLHRPSHTSASKAASTQCMLIFLYTGWYVHTVWSVVRMNVDSRRAQPAWRLTISHSPSLTRWPPPLTVSSELTMSSYDCHRHMLPSTTSGRRKTRSVLLAEKQLELELLLPVIRMSTVRSLRAPTSCPK